MAQRSSQRFPLNPLTVIGSLIGVVELAFAYPVTQLSGSNQTIVVIFMVGFPILLLLAFFLIVWFRPGHLYGPKDYSKDESFLEGIRQIPGGSPRRIEEQQTVGQTAPRITPPGT